MDRTDFQQALVAIQSKYVETPTLKLTLGQVARLLTLPNDVCEAAVDVLVATGFLVELTDESYRRRGTPPVQVEHLVASTWAVRPRLNALRPDGSATQTLAARGESHRDC